MKETLDSDPFDSAGRRWPWRFAVAFVLLILVALVMVPWGVQRRVNRMRAEILASEPARTLVMQWQFDLAREISALNDLLLTGDTAQYTTYARALKDEEEIRTTLAPFARRLGPEVVEPFTRAATLAEQWHRRVRDEELLRERAVGLTPVEVPRERQLFENVLRSVAAVNSAIVRVTDRARARISAAEQTGLTFTLVLGVLAFLAAAAVIALETRVRRFAEEAGQRRRDADEALAKSAEAAEARNRLMRGITHDVKNPLGAAKGYAELLAMGVKAPLASGQAPLVEGIERSIDSALAIITDLLDFARMDSGGVSVNRVEVDLNDIARQAVQDHHAAATSSGHVIEAEPSPEPLIVHTDPLRVRQVLDNLLSNALKYTPPPGRIVARVRVASTDEGPRPGSWATIRVSDTGPGVPPAQRDTIFDEFTRLDDGAGTKGHGLGLAIARGLARHLGGDLTIADTDSGATFVLWIPQRDQAESHT